MITPLTPALKTVRGFQGTPVTSGDEDSDYGIAGTPASGASTRRGRKKRVPIINDVVSANCSPVLKAAASPSMSGIAKLRMQLDPLSLDSTASSRASSMTRSESRHRFASPLATPSLTNDDRSSTFTSESTNRDRTSSSNGSGDDTASETTTCYEIGFESDFASDSVRE